MSASDAALVAVLAGRYTLERDAHGGPSLLGQGGMATVYLARDLRHHRMVAIKVLKPELAAAIGSERFLREIETTASLRHPHILPLYDSGLLVDERTGDPMGRPLLYYVMPYVDGESLRARLSREKQLPLEDALRIAREVGNALSYAHDRGVIHRDIKPENILLESGHAIVADFGIARAITAGGGERLTETGLAVGTVQYMSPEQAAGDRVLDGRSDQYALGSVLYEMLAGQPPFTGPTAESIVRQQMVATPVPITQLRPAVPPAVEGALQRALAKTPADRFDTITRFTGALTAPASGPAGRGPPVRGSVRRSRAAIIPMAAVMLFGAVVAGVLLGRRRGEGAPPPGRQSVAVLPFVDLSPDRTSEYLGDGMAETLINALANVPGLSVPARTSSFSFKGNPLDVRDIGRQLGVAAVLEGSVQRAGNHLRVTAQLIKTADGLHLWSENFDRDAGDIFAVQDEVARAVVTALQVRLARASDTSLANQGTRSPAAYDDYLLGRFYWNKRTAPDLVRAAAYFKQAIQADSNYAQAWSGLTDSYVLFVPAEYNVPGIDPDSILTLAERSARRALVLAPRLGEAYSSLGEILEYRLKWEEALTAFELGVAMSPNYPTAHQWYSYDLMMWNRWDEAIREMERAKELDPLSMVITVSLAAAYDGAERWHDAETMYDQSRALAPDHPLVLLFVSYHELIHGEFEALAADYPRLLRVTGTDSASAMDLGRRLRKPASRKAALRDIIAHRDERVSSRAVVYRVLDGDDRVIRYLSSLTANRTGGDVGGPVLYCFLGTRLRADPQMQAVLAHLGYPALGSR